MKNVRKTGQSRAQREKESRATGAKTRRKSAASADAGGSQQAAAIEAVAPVEEIKNDGTDARIKSALDSLLSKSLARDNKGRFVHGQVKTGAESEGLFNDLAPLKAEIVAAVRVQLAADHDDAPPTLLAVIDAFAEAHLLRKATFMQLSARGGPVTNKGRVRGLLSAWGSFFDKEIRAAERLGLQRLSRRVLESPREWLEQSAANRNHDEETTQTT